ncbi:unnamed protein product [Mytilus coruscus]|uniref:Uncharacterized protein n=1 Tax=Mytilus coruscus TaxID=42192 RepID=A0A6J8A4K7_MYTCO|nr:unnamed protein product [Mytilus coruscus]
MYTISLALDYCYGRSDAKTISDLLSKGANPNLTPHDKDPPLIVATIKNLREVLECLIKGGAKLDAVSRDGDTAVVVCCKKASQKYYQTLNVLIESGASLNIASKKGEYPLEILSQKIKDVKNSGFNHLMGALLAYQSKDNDEIENCVTKMLTKGANPNITREGRHSPLIIAVQKQSENLVQILLNAGADILHVGENKRTALDLCFSQGTLSIRDIIIKALVENPKCYSTSDTIGSFGAYLLDMLIENDVEDAILESAISNGADPNLVTLGKDSPLMKAIERGRYKISCVLIEAGADVIYANADGTNAFDVFSEICKTLQDNPYTHQKYSFRSKRVHSRKSKTSEDADEDNWADIMKKLLRCFMVSGIEVNKRTKYGIYPLQVPIWLNSVEMTKWALEHEADVNIVDDLKNSPLTIALENSHIDIVQILLDNKANVNYTGHRRSETEVQIKVSLFVESSNSECNDKDMEDPLLTKVILGNTNTKDVLVKMLLKAGADPNTVIKGVDSPLLHAIRTRNLEIVKILLEAGADVKHVGLNSYTALHVYFQHDIHNMYSYKHYLKMERRMRGNTGPSQILQLLLGAKAPVNSMCNSNELPVHFAMHVCSQIKDEEIEEDIRLVLDYFKDVNIPDKNGNTLLIIACAECSFDIIHKIILHGADVCYRGNEGLTAFQAHMDSATFDKKVVSLLIKHGADINIINDTGETALIRYIKRGRQKVSSENVLFLLEIGADPNINKEGCNSALTEALYLNLFSLLPCLLNAKSKVNHVGKNGTTALQIILGKVETATDHRFEDEDFSDEEYDFPARKIVRNRITVKTTTDTSFEDEDLSDEWYVSPAKICLKHRITVCTVVTQLLSAGADVNFVSKDGESPLYILLKLHDTRLVDTVLRLFIKNGADPNKGKEVPLILAAQQNRQKALKMLLEAGADVDKRNLNGDTALISSLSAFSKSIDVETATDHRFEDEDFSDEEYDFPARKIVRNRITDKTIETVKILLESGASINLKDGSGNIPLSLPLITRTHISDFNKFYLHGSDFSRKRMISILLEKGACPNSQLDGEDSPLMLAVENSLTECVKQLLESGANPDHLGKEGKTALHKYFSATAQNFHGRRNDRGNNPAEDQTLRSQWVRKPGVKRVFEKQRLKIIDLLLSNGAHVNMDEDGHDSPLLLSIQHEDIEAMLVLLTAKPNLCHKGLDNLNAFEKSLKAENNNGLRMFDILLQHQTPDEDNIADLFYLLWEYCKANEALDTTLLENICVDLLSTDTEIKVNLAKKNEDSPLIYFCRLQCNESIKMLLARKADVNHIGTRGKTVLHTLIEMSGIDTCNLKEMVETIFSAKPTVNIKDETGKSPLETCISMYNRHYGYNLKSANIGLLIQHLLDTGASSSSSELDKVLKQAAEKGDFKTMESLCRHGANTHMTDNSGNTILHLCWSKSLNGALQFLEYYLKEVGCLNKINKNGNSPLLVLLEKCKRQTDINEKTDDQIADIANFFMKNTTTEILASDGNSPLHFAAESGLIQTIEVLLSSGANASRQNQNGRTALHSCLENPKSNIVEVVSKLTESGNASVQLEISDCEMTLLQLLIDKGTNVNATDNEGKSALIVAVKHSREQIIIRSLPRRSNVPSNHNVIEELIRHGADVKIVDKKGDTALTMFCKNGSSIEIGMTLLQSGADPSVGNCLQSVLENYELRENQDFLLELLKKGANPNMHSGYGSNLIEVTRKENTQLVEELLRYGAVVNFVDNNAKKCSSLCV